jgi:hypothetical protein
MVGDVEQHIRMADVEVCDWVQSPQKGLFMNGGCYGADTGDWQ